jgi:D-sedoheptulose 7-phosphate isomerase
MLTDAESGNAIADLVFRYPSLASAVGPIREACEALIACFSAGGKALVCGNGGSAADSDHIVGELMKGFLLPRRIGDAFRKKLVEQDEKMGSMMADGLQGALPAISLVRHDALSSAFANDAVADLGFAQQVAGYGRPGDLLWCLSTSGDSPNVLYAALAAKALGLVVLGMTGATGGALASRCDILIAVDALETYKIQELHLPVYHAICRIVEEVMFRDIETMV